MSGEEGASKNELLMAAAKSDNLEMLDEVLSDDSSSFDINHMDGAGNSALHYAAKSASTGCLEVLLYYDGIDINIVNRMEGDTPLHKAAAFEDTETALHMVQLLIMHGASPSIRNRLKQTAADKAPGDTHQEIKAFLEQAEIGNRFAAHDVRDIVADNSDSDDGGPSDEE
ncbi:hypothetical protein BGW38_010593 [Lunasporangiospora selenospora]|uniref:Ankyrin repeat-containing protein n=1 Tax=Lunasporangiospora selenospora TaxID=979761 RepID=A0A9P6G2N0_9FUNG|nr:hypothetical protein BGW38_010593 [Lunasporangiospora selenospora]